MVGLHFLAKQVREIKINLKKLLLKRYPTCTKDEYISSVETIFLVFVNKHCE